MANLEARALDIIADSLHGMTDFDLDTLRDRVRDAIGDGAEGATIYTSRAMDIISEYEREHGSEAEELADSGKEYKASQWQEAMTSYAYWIAYAALSSFTETSLDEMEAAGDTLVDVLSVLSVDCGADDLVVHRDCPHGWAPHDRESEADGQTILEWTSRQLDGCNALAVHVAGVWLSYTWTPEA